MDFIKSDVFISGAIYDRCLRDRWRHYWRTPWRHMHPQMEKRPAEYLDLENDLDSLLPSDGKVGNEFGLVAREPHRGAVFKYGIQE